MTEGSIKGAYKTQKMEDRCKKNHDIRVNPPQEEEINGKISPNSAKGYTNVKFNTTTGYAIFNLKKHYF